MSWTIPRFSTSMNQLRVGGVNQPHVSAMDINAIFNTIHDKRLFNQQDAVAIKVSIGLT